MGWYNEDPSQLRTSRGFAWLTRLTIEVEAMTKSDLDSDNLRVMRRLSDWVDRGKFTKSNMRCRT